MLPPGLAFAALSDKAWKFVERSDLPKFYFNFKKELKSAQKNQNSFTPAISLFVGLRESLRLIRKESLEGVFRRHEKLAEATPCGSEGFGSSSMRRGHRAMLYTVKVRREYREGS
jgi:aspartate aminotransferase-like enzyme